MSKNENMLAILWMLNSGDRITAKQMSEKLEMNIRSVYRYIDALCASGVPIVSDSGHHGGYRLLNDFIQAPLLFNAKEQKALLHASIFAQEAGYPFSEALNSAASKLKMYTNQEQLSTLNRHLNGLDVIGGSNDPAVRRILTTLEQAVADQYSVEMEYRSSRDEQSKKRRVDPYGMIYWNSRWYMVGYCRLRNEVRSFRTDRITCLKRTELNFKRPDSFSVRQFFLKNLLPAWRSDDGAISLVIEGKAAALDDLCHNWFMSHYLTERSVNRASFLLDETTVHKYVPYFLLPYGKFLKVLEPIHFRNTMQAILQDLLDFYDA